MDGPDTASFIYYGIFAVAIGSYVLVQYRDRMSQGLQHAAIWVLIFLGVVVAYGFKDTLTEQIFPRQGIDVSATAITLPAARDGHYYADVRVNGEWVEFFVDTGATSIVLTQQDAERVGFDTGTLRYFGTAMTANGPVKTAPVTLDSMQLGDFTDTNLKASVNGGDLDISLLGMDYLRLFDRIEIEDDRLRLFRD